MAQMVNKVKCLLIYYTGTFNTRYVTQKLRERLERESWQVDTYEIDPLIDERLDYSPYDFIGLGSPIYGFCAPYPFLKFIQKQRFPRGLRAFIYKNSGETLPANDSSHKYVIRKLRHDGVRIEHEYHLLMPYNIHFRYEDALIREMMEMNRRLMDIMAYELTHDIPHMPKRSLISKVMSSLVSRPQYVAGDINSYFYKVDKEKCTECNLCMKRCPTQNIHRNEHGDIAFRHNCLMCMRCSLYCPADAIKIGFLDAWGWRVNKGYALQRIEQLPLDKPYITPETKGFFRCYIPTYARINRRYKELFGTLPDLPQQEGLSEAPLPLSVELALTASLFKRIKRPSRPCRGEE